MTLEIDPDIRRASTPPSRFYRDAAFFEWTRTELFARTWHFLGDSEGVRGQRPFFIGDEPLVLTRDAGGTLHCLSNVCTHRGNLVVQKPGQASGLRCRYHGRRFALDGTFEHMPEFEEACDFPTKQDNLPRVPLERWGPFLFVALDPAFDLARVVEPIDEPSDSFVLNAERSRDYEVQAHWMLYVENYLEGFHIPYVHGGLNKEIDYGTYRTELHTYANVQIGTDPKSGPAAHYWWLFPNTMLNFYPWGISVNVVTPLAIDRTRISFCSYVSDAALLGEGAGSDLHEVEVEDEQIVEAVQKGMQARLYDRGRYSPTREQGVHHFHRLIAEFHNA